jgi:hypothetical protein
MQSSTHYEIASCIFPLLLSLIQSLKATKWLANTVACLEYKLLELNIVCGTHLDLVVLLTRVSYRNTS